MTLQERKEELIREAWIRNVIAKLGYTREQAMASHARIYGRELELKK